jgi:hypothetical protein
VKRAISIHRRDFISILALVVGAIVVTGYIFAHQPAFTGVFGLFGKNYYTVKAELSSASAVTSGQGQTVDIAGVEVGQIGGVTVRNGRAVVTMNIYKKYAPIYRNSTVLLRRDPLSSRQRYAGLPAAAVVERRAGVQGQPQHRAATEPGRGRGSARRVQAVRAAEP